jgi:hypothetical protein
MKHKLLILAFAMTSCGPSASGGASDTQIMSAAMEIVKSRLKDPGSAQFSDFYLSRKAGTPVMCGKVNSKNGFGGMTGPQRFIGGGVAALEEDMAPGEMDVAWAKMC